MPSGRWWPSIFGQHPAAEVITSLLGLGAVLAARLLGQFADHPAYPVLQITELAVCAACGMYLLVALEAVLNHVLYVFIRPDSAAGS